MKANFKATHSETEETLNYLAEDLASHSHSWGFMNNTRTPPVGFGTFHCIDVGGAEFAWLNEAFPQEKYTWYLWFESIFLVPNEMASFLLLKWGNDDDRVYTL